jgi:hypothetical protein
MIEGSEEATDFIGTQLQIHVGYQDIVELLYDKCARVNTMTKQLRHKQFTSGEKRPFL